MIPEAAALDVALERLKARREAWIATPTDRRVALLRQCLACTQAAADTWVETISTARGIDPDGPLAGEERLSGPFVLMRLLRLLAESGEGSAPRLPAHVTEAGRTVAHVFPRTAKERLLWMGFRGEIWLQPGRSAERNVGWRRTAREGRLALVLGAGNISSIGPCDALHMLFAENAVVLLKLNPLMAKLQPVLEAALAPLIQEGFLALCAGGKEEGEFLVHHPAVEAIHLTGSHHTYDALVWGSDPAEAEARRREGRRLVNVPVTAELGCVTPVLVVPGPWSDADLAYQARHVASMVYHNAGFNCSAAQVLITDRRWPQRAAFLNRLRKELTGLPTRPAWYPGAPERYSDLAGRYPQAEILGRPSSRGLRWALVPDVPIQEGEPALTQEAFCGLLFEAPVDAGGTMPFLDAAVDVANDKLWGNLSAVLLVHPHTARHHANALESALERLHYGSVGVNVWGGVTFGLPELPWGAAPGNPPEEIRSGVGFVHNAYGFENPEKSVVRGPFRTAYTPPYFAGHGNLPAVGSALCDFEADPDWGEAFRILLQTLKGGLPPGVPGGR